MKRRAITLILILACLASAGSRLFAEGAKRSFIITNKSTFGIAEIAISPAGQDDWSDNFLGDDTLGKGEAAKLSFEESDPEALYDLTIVDDEGDAHLFEGIPLAVIGKLTIATEGGELTLKNK